MTNVLSLTGTIFVIVIVGYSSLRWRLLTRNALGTLSAYVINIALPALIFNALSTRSLTDIANTSYLIGYLSATLLVLVFGYLVSKYFWQTDPVASTFDAAGMACANSGFVGYPLLLLALPAVAQTAIALNMLVENLVIIPLVLILAERASSSKRKGLSLIVFITKRLLTNPLVIAMIAGLLVVIADIKLPVFAVTSINLLAQSSAAVCLFVIGGTLCGVTASKFGFRMFGIVSGKLILLPILVFLTFELLDRIGFGVSDHNLRKAAIIMASTPAMTLYPILAEQFGEADQASASMLVMTVMSFFTMSGVLFLLEV